MLTAVITHSAGIIGGEGTVHPYQVYNMGGMLGRVQCDGKHYCSLQGGQILNSVNDIKIVALFELGRLMERHQVTPMMRV